MFFSTANTTTAFTFPAAGPGIHNFTLTKLTEARFGKAAITGLETDGRLAKLAACYYACSIVETKLLTTNIRS